jgi:hypothetical protein
MKETIRSSETSVLTRATRRHIPKDDILLIVMSVKIPRLLFQVTVFCMPYCILIFMRLQSTELNETLKFVNKSLIFPLEK